MCPQRYGVIAVAHVVSESAIQIGNTTHQYIKVMGQWLSIIPAIVPIGQCRGRLVVLCTVVSVAEVTLEVGLLPYLALLQFCLV